MNQDILDLQQFKLVNTGQLMSWIKARYRTEGSIPGSVKSETASATSCHRCDVSQELCCPGAKLRRWASPLVARFGVMARV